MVSPPRASPRAAAKPLSPPAWQTWRIADGRFEPLSGIGPTLVGGRWNSPGLGVIYASRTYAGAMLEILAHAGIGRVPKTHVAIEIAIAGDAAVERHEECRLPVGWDQSDLRVARSFGDAWIREARSAVLMVPSVVARKEYSVLLNPQLPDFLKIAAARPEAVIWDARLFARH